MTRSHPCLITSRNYLYRIHGWLLLRIDHDPVSYLFSLHYRTAGGSVFRHMRVKLWLFINLFPPQISLTHLQFSYHLCSNFYRSDIQKIPYGSFLPFNLVLILFEIDIFSWNFTTTIFYICLIKRRPIDLIMYAWTVIIFRVFTRTFLKNTMRDWK